MNVSDACRLPESPGSFVLRSLVPIVVIRADFGFLPVPLALGTCELAIDTRPDFEEAVASIREDKDGIEGNWILRAAAIATRRF